MDKLRVFARMQLILMFLFACLLSSCEKRRKSVEYHFTDSKEGWYFIIYDLPGYPKLPEKDDRIILSFSEQKKIIYTSSSPQIGWAEDRYYVGDAEVKAEDMMGLSAWKVNCWKKEGNITVLKYDEIYFGDGKNIDNYENSDHQIEKVLNKIRSCNQKETEKIPLNNTPLEIEGK